MVPPLVAYKVSLSATTESRLAICAAANGTCYGELVLGMMGLVRSMAKDRADGTSADLRQELESEGTLALCESARIYSASGAECRFSTFAGVRINRAMVSYLRTSSCTGTGTEWRARRQQHARRERKWLSSVIGSDPTDAEVNWVASADDLASAAREQIAVVPMEEAREADIGVPPEVEDGAEYRFHDRWMALTPSQKVLLSTAEKLGMADDGHRVMYSSGGVSLTQLAVAVKERRSIVERQLGEALVSMLSL